MTQEPGTEPDIADLIEKVGRAYKEAAETILALKDRDKAFTYAGTLAQLIDQLDGDIAVVRARIAEAIHSAEKLSLAGLAARVRVSKSRADQWVRTAKKAKEAKEGQG